MLYQGKPSGEHCRVPSSRDGCGLQDRVVHAFQRHDDMALRYPEDAAASDAIDIKTKAGVPAVYFDMGQPRDKILGDRELLLFHGRQSSRPSNWFVYSPDGLSNHAVGKPTNHIVRNRTNRITGLSYYDFRLGQSLDQRPGDLPGRAPQGEQAA